MLKRVWFWLNNSRLYSAHMSILSWFVVFNLALPKCNQIRDYIFGILCLIAITLCQLATNLLDDYFDYKDLKKKGCLDANTRSKCAYITSGDATLEQLLHTIIVYCGISTIIGAILLYFTGLPVLYFAIAGGVIVLGYQLMSKFGLSELAVFLAFGPIFFGGVYWVMTQSLSVEVFLIGCIVSIFTTGLLYTHTVLDFDGDKLSCKKTLCSYFKTKDDAVIGLALIYLIGYGLIVAGVILKFLPDIMLLAIGTSPMAAELLLTLLTYNQDKNNIPYKKFWHFPMENFENLKKEGLASFMFRFYQARNIMIYTSLLICIANIIDVYF